MANPYRELFKAPGSRVFVLAGAVAATFALATAFCVLQVSRLWIGLAGAGSCRWRR